MNGKFVTVLVLVAALSVGLVSVAFAQGGVDTQGRVDNKGFEAELKPLNRSGASGHADLTKADGNLKVNIHSEGMAPELPHAQHIHGMAQAISECPTLAADDNNDGLINTAEGLPSYGPIKKSLTTRGDTSPASALAVSRFPVANADGDQSYSRKFEAGRKLRRNLGDFAIVQHGVDLNGNGKYDFKAAGASELDPSLPQEATIPANCGVINPVTN
jgi:hypothetical protein